MSFDSHSKSKILSILVANTLLCSSCSQNRPESETEKVAAKSGGAEVVQPLYASSTTAGTLAEAKAAMEERYHVRPDRRFLRAIEFLYRYCNLKQGSVDCNFQNGFWIVTCADKEIGKLPEFATFDEQFRLVDSWAKVCCQSSNPVLSTESGKHQVLEPLESLEPAKLIEVVANADQDWRAGKRDLNNLEVACRALAWLCTEQIDAFGIGDDLYARTLALLAMSNNLGGTNVKISLGMLANSMGYKSNAPSAVTSEKSPKSPRIPFLRNLVGKGTEQMKCGLGLQLMSDVEAELVGTAVEPIAEPDLQWNADKVLQSSRWTIKEPTKHFEKSLIASSLQRIPQTAKAEVYQRTGAASVSLFDRSLAEDFYRGAFYAGLSMVMESYLNLPSGAQIVQSLIESIDSGTSSLDKSNAPAANNLNSQNAPVPSELDRSVMAWISLRSKVRFSGLSLNDLQRGIASTKTLGLIAVSDVLTDYETVHFAKPIDEEYGRQIATDVVECADGRPAYLKPACTVIDRPIWNPWLTAVLYDGLSRSSPATFETLTRYSGAFRDQQLKTFLARKSVPLTRKLQVVTMLVHAQKQFALLDSLFSSLIAQEPESFLLAQEYARLLIANKKFDAATKLIDGWLARKSLNTSGDSAMRILQTQILIDKKEYSKAAQALNMVSDKKSLRWMTLKSRLLATTKQESESLHWAEAAIELYPRAQEAFTNLIDVLWRTKKFQEAAEKIAARHISDPNIWEFSLGPKFAATFCGDQSGAKIALNAMFEAGISGRNSVGRMANAALRENCPNLAFEIAAAAPAGQQTSLGQQLWAYHYLLAWRGVEAATEWLKTNLRADASSDEIAEHAFNIGEPELLWSVIPEASTSQRVWLIRAAMSTPQQPQKQRQAMLNHFEHRTDLVEKLALYMLDAKNESDLLKLKISHEKIPLAAFFYSWGNFKQGKNLFQTVEWMRVSVESGESENPDSIRSLTWLHFIQDMCGNTTIGVMKPYEHMRIYTAANLGGKIFSTRYAVSLVPESNQKKSLNTNALP